MATAIRISTPPRLAPEERRKIATSVLSCPVCSKRLRAGEAVTCPTCELRRYCSEEHRHADRDHPCGQCPKQFAGMVESVMADLDALEVALKKSHGMERADGHRPLVRNEEDVEHIAPDLLATFSEVSYFGIFSVPMEHADSLSEPSVLAQVVPPLNNAILDSWALREAIHFMLDTEQTDTERFLRAKREEEDPVGNALVHFLAIYIPLIAHTMATLPEQVHPDDLLQRRIFRKQMTITLRRLLVALKNLKTGNELDDIPSFFAGLVDRYGDLFAPWKGGSRVEEVFGDSDGDDDDFFADVEEFSEEDDEDDDFMDAEETFQARMERLFGGKNSPRGARSRAAPADPDPDPTITSQKLTDALGCLGQVLNVYGYPSAVILVPFVQIACSLATLQGVYEANRVRSDVIAEKALTIASNSTNSGRTFYIAPQDFGIGDMDKIHSVSKGMNDTLVKQNAFVTVQAVDCAKMLFEANRVELGNTARVTTPFHLSKKLQGFYHWPARVLSPYVLADVRSKPTGTTGVHFMHNIAPAFHSNIGALATALAVLQQTSTFNTPNMFNAVLLYTAVTCLQSWMALLGHFLKRAVFLDLSESQRAIKETIAIFKRRMRGVYYLKKNAFDKDGKPRYPEKTAAAMNALNQGKLESFYDHMAKGDKEDKKKFKEFFKTIHDGGYVEYDTKRELFEAMKQMAEKKGRGAGQMNFYFAGIETSELSTMFTIADQAYKAANPQKTLQESYSTRFQNLHTGTLFYDLLKIFGVIVVDIGLSKIGGYKSVLMLNPVSIWSSFGSLCGMAMAPLLISKVPVGIFNALAVTVAIGNTVHNIVPAVTNFAKSLMPSHIDGWIAHNAMVQVSFLKPLATAMTVVWVANSLYNLPLVARLLGATVSETSEHNKGMIKEMWNRAKLWLYKWRAFSWLTDTYAQSDKKMAKHPFYTHLFFIGLKIGGGMVFRLIASYFLGPLADEFIGFSFVLAAMAKKDDQLLAQVLTLTTFTIATKLFGGKEDGALRALSAPPEKSMPKVETSPTPDTGLEKAAAEAAESNAEFERIVSDILETMNPSGAERARRTFDELRLACTDVVSDVVDYIVSGDEKFLPKAGATPVPYTRFIAATSALISTVSEPVPGQWLYKTSANSPEEARPIPFEEQAGAELIRRAELLLAQFSRVAPSETPVSFDGRKRTKQRPPRKRRAKHSKKAPKAEAKKEEPSPQFAARAMSAMRKLGNKGVLLVGALSHALLSAKAAASAHYTPHWKTVTVGGNEHFKLDIVALSEEKEGTLLNAYDVVINILETRPNELLKDGQHLVARVNAFVSELGRNTGVDIDLDKITKHDATLNALFNGDNAAMAEYDKRWHRDMVKDFGAIINNATEVVQPGASLKPNDGATPGNNSSPPLPRGFIQQTLGNLVPALVSENPWMFAHAIVSAAAELTTFELFAKTMRFELLGRRAELSRYDAVKLAISLGPLLLDLVYACVTHETWLSNSQHYYFAINSIWEVHSLMHKWRGRRDSRADRFDQMFRISTGYGSNTYQNIQIQRTLPFATLLAVRGTDSLFGNVLATSLASSLLMFVASVGTALIHEKLVSTGRFRPPIVGDRKSALLRTALFSAPVILPLVITFPVGWDALTIALVTLFMNTDADIVLGRQSVARVAALTTIAYHITKNAEAFKLQDPLVALYYFLTQQAAKLGGVFKQNSINITAELERSLQQLAGSLDEFTRPSINTTEVDRSLPELQFTTPTDAVPNSINLANVVPGPNITSAEDMLRSEDDFKQETEKPVELDAEQLIMATSQPEPPSYLDWIGAGVKSVGQTALEFITNPYAPLTRGNPTPVPASPDMTPTQQDTPSTTTDNSPWGPLMSGKTALEDVPAANQALDIRTQNQMRAIDEGD